MSNNEEDDAFFPQMDLLGSSSQQQESRGNTLGENDDSVYVLPKTYNGKTVTELFPEFDYDSVGELTSINYRVEDSFSRFLILN
jgi:hypothetical protein